MRRRQIGAVTAGLLVASTLVTAPPADAAGKTVIRPYFLGATGAYQPKGTVWALWHVTRGGQFGIGIKYRTVKLQRLEGGTWKTRSVKKTDGGGFVDWVVYRGKTYRVCTPDTWKYDGKCSSSWRARATF